MVSWQKLSAAIGSATPDPTKGEATTQPVPPPSVANKPAPGRKGPVGLQPRQTYSRVNTGAPPVPDAGTITQKSQRPRGLEFLPAKVAYQEKTSMSTTTMMRRPSLLSLVKEAMEGTASQVDINTEAMFQQENIEEAPPPQEKTASVDLPDVVPTEYVEKVAVALDFLSKQAEEGKNKLEPGKGPGALGVLEATSSEENVDVNMGQAKTQIPMKPPMTSSGVAKDPSNAMDDNIDMSHPEQPIDPMGNEKTSSTLLAKNMVRLGVNSASQTKMASSNNLLAKNIERLGLAKKASAPANNLLARNLAHLGLTKSAEDAINPAKIAAGTTQTGSTPPEGASASEEQVPSEPSDVNKQKALIGSNDAAINYTKGQAKADPKSDVNKVLNEPALTSATDKVLQQTFDNTAKAGVKISQVRRDLTKTAAAQALLSKIAQEAEKEKKEKKNGKKEKESQMGTGLGTPAGQSGFQASNMGM